MRGLIEAVLHQVAQIEGTNADLAIGARFDRDPHDVVDRRREHRAPVLAVPMREVGAAAHEADAQRSDGVDPGLVGPWQEPAV